MAIPKSIVEYVHPEDTRTSLQNMLIQPNHAFPCFSEENMCCFFSLVMDLLNQQDYKYIDFKIQRLIGQGKINLLVSIFWDKYYFS